MEEKRSGVVDVERENDMMKRNKTDNSCKTIGGKDEMRNGDMRKYERNEVLDCKKC